MARSPTVFSPLPFLTSSPFVTIYLIVTCVNFQATDSLALLLTLTVLVPFKYSTAFVRVRVCVRACGCVRTYHRRGVRVHIVISSLFSVLCSLPPPRPPPHPSPNPGSCRT